MGVVTGFYLNLRSGKGKFLFPSQAEKSLLGLEATTASVKLIERSEHDRINPQNAINENE